MRTVILVPRRDDGGERDALWAWARRRWERYHPGYPIVEGHHDDGPFNRSAAVNRAARAAGDWDLGIVIDSDIFLRRSQVEAAVQRAADTGRVTWAHMRWRGLHESWTRRVIADRQDFGAEVDGADMDVLVERTNPISWSCCIVFPRAVFDDMGGFDERFRGWGYEDMAVQSVVAGLYGHERIPGDVYHLWHPRVFGSGRADKVKGEYSIEAVTNARLGRRYMVALRRDHALHDRSDLPTNEEERQRDIANLVRDDAKIEITARRLGLPDWSAWWPTLAELQAGWKAAAATRSTITAVVTSGGTAETWPERRSYLEQSLASFAENVTGGIVQKVVYSDWGDEVRPELATIADRHGFYVAGDGHHGHTAMRQRLWRYLGKHAQGEYIFGTEDDFTYERPVDLEALARVLDADPHLAQIALLRDACYQDEVETGGILGWPEPAFTRVGANGTSRLEHRQFWTNNPSIYRKGLTARPWPPTREDPVTGRGPGSEVVFGQQLVRDSRVRFAFWGSGENWVKHVGKVRAGSGY